MFWHDLYQIVLMEIGLTWVGQGLATCELQYQEVVIHAVCGKWIAIGM